MKKVMFALLFLVLFQVTKAQIINSGVAENQALKFEFNQWSSYSNYAGYHISLTNYTDEEMEVRVQFATGIDTLITMQPHEYNTYRVGYGLPYNEGLNMFVFVFQRDYHFILRLRTSGSPYAAAKR